MGSKGHPNGDKNQENRIQGNRVFHVGDEALRLHGIVGG